MTSKAIRYTAYLLSTAAAVALCAPGPSAEAQDVAPSVAGVLDEIVVSARKRDENLQDVSSTVSALSAAELGRRFDTDVRDFANAAPNVVIDDLQQGPGGVAATTIRGIGVADVEKSIDPAVGVVLDEIYLGTSSGNLVKAIDIDRMEILSGPQGTLFGRNAIGGVINLTRSRPTQELTGKARLTYGNYNTRNIEGLVSGGVTDWAALKVTGAWNRTDGFITNRTLRRDGQRETFSALGSQLLLTPTDKVEVSVSYDMQRTKTDPPQLLNMAKPTDLFCSVYGQCATSLTVPQSGDRYVSVGNDGSPRRVPGKDAKFDMELLITKGKWIISDDYDLQYIFGRMTTDERIYQDFDATPLLLYETDRPAKYDQNTHEVRLTKSNGPLTFVAGGYYWDSGYTINLVSHIGFAVPNTILDIPQTVTQTTESYAGFFEADYKVLDALKLTVGGRYTHDKKTSLVNGGGIAMTTPAEKSWSKFTPKASVSYNFTDDVMAYFLFSSGYRSGGFNGRPNSVAAANFPYNPEKVNNFELGLKSQLLDNRLRFNASAFLMKYKNKQEDVDVPVPSSSIGRENRTVNASAADLKGFEASVTAVITEEFSLSGNLGYLDAKYKRFLADTNNDGVVDDNTRLKLRRAPKWNYTISGTYEREFGETGKGWLQADMHYLGAHEITFLNNPAVRNKGQYLLDGSLNYLLSSTNTQISLFARNLLGEDGYVVGYDVQGIWTYAAARSPRTFGVALTQKF
jgi:iron complex outermembrane receptor protein